MNIAGRELILRVMIGPYLVWRVLIKGSSWDDDFRSHRILVMMGICGGPGGRVPVVLLVVVREEKMALMRNMMHREASAMNHVSIT
jgi:hypothetical protein